MAARHADYIDDPRFNKTFELPADLAVGCSSPFKVKYADYGYRNEIHPEKENVLLFYGPLLGSRLIHIAKDKMAKEYNIRIINFDRPGIGGTHAVHAKYRMSLWLVVVCELLKHLEIQYVSVACHSGGLVYALDMLLHHPQILHPERPYLAIGGPWILPSHTGSTALSIIQSLPIRAIGQTDKVAKLINNYIGPFVGTTLGFGLSLVSKFLPAPLQGCVVIGEDARFEEELMPVVIKRIYSEGIRGTSSDAILLMQKIDGANGWSDWGDYDALVPRLAEALRASGRMLKVDVFYAENDFMIGNGHSKGAVWFDGCWDRQTCGDVIDYSSTTVKGADHDGIWNLKCGVAKHMFEKLAGGPKAELG